MYEGRTLAEAGRKWQNDAKFRVEQIARYLGVDMDLSNRAWYEDGGTPGHFFKRKSRDQIAFVPLKTQKIRRVMGEARPVGEQKNELAVVDDAGPNAFDTVETLGWTRSQSLELSDVNSMTHGWSVTVSAGFEIGGDAQGGKVIGGLEIGAHGEYSKETAETKSTSVEASHTTTVELKAGEMARLIQTVRTGEIEIDVTDYIVLELGWRIRDWKTPNNALLKDHSGFGGKERSKSRWHWDCTDTFDLQTMGEGHSPRYPGLRGRNLHATREIGDDLRWLLNEGNRTIVVRSKALFKQGVWGNAKVQRLDASGEVADERDAAE